MRKFIPNLCKLIGHKWETTHTNQWQMPTREKCKCGLSRDLEYRVIEDKFYYVYSDGTEQATTMFCEG